MSGESRSELLLWLNTLLALDYTKVEQCGSGAAYCQILDSVFQDVPMAKVRFDASGEYQYLTNYKVLQAAFLKHRIEKTIVVERLVKCRFQDNLEFLQWLKKFWMDNKDETEYDPVARRGARGTGARSSAVGTGVTRATSVRGVIGASGGGRGGGAAPRLGSAPARVGSASGGVSSSVSDGNSRSGSRAVAPLARSIQASQSPSPIASRQNSGALATAAQIQRQQQQIQELTAQLESSLQLAELLRQEADELRLAAEGLETERNFYFNKLREIEIMVQNTSEDASARATLSVDGFVGMVQEVLYSTEEGFQLPEVDGSEPMDDEETF